MSDLSQRIAAMSPEKQALLAQRLKGGTAASKGAEPLAIVGIGCRLPGGADSPEALWSLLAQQRDAVTDVPPDRWDVEALFDPNQERRGTMTSRWGAWLAHLDEFDASFFGVSPREAGKMDPQQRLLLEVAFEALEDAGQTLEGLAGSRTGVYVGTHANDYSWMVFGDAHGLDAYASTGTAHSIVANRLSYVFDLRGPSVAVDTACSASLVAVHLACQGLRYRECDMAVAGGINLILSPLWAIALSKLGMLSPRGRCRTFDAGADGIVRGEGCGAVVLKRLSDAVAAGDRIWAVVRGTATNQDGRTNGITAPNGLSQQTVVRAALRDAGLPGDAISAVETHGTGTILGDPIEVEALAEVLGKGDPATSPCFLGSIKTNIGHLEGAAGMAGILKLVMSLDKESWPALAHFESLNPHIAASGTRFVFPRQLQAWPRGAVPRRAGVSAFGFGGTNAHIIIEEAPDVPVRQSAHDTPPYVVTVSAQTPEALCERARLLGAFLETHGREVPLADVSYTTLRRRSRHEHGASIAGRTRGEIVERLGAVAAGAAPRGTELIRRPAGRPGAIAFVYSGQGSQWARMGIGLATDPVLAAALADCDAAIRAEAGWSVVEELARPEASSRLDQTEYAQPAIFAVQVALTRWFGQFGIVPDVVIGHSVGEIAAAHAAGALDLAQAARVVVRRARLMQAATGAGRMVAVEASVEELANLSPSGGEIGWAAFNSPTSRVLSGERGAVEALTASLESRGFACKMLPVDYAFHSPQMKPHARALAAQLEGLAPSRLERKFISTVTGNTGDAATATPDYWRRNVEEPVLFDRALETALRSGVRQFVEVGPHAVLGRALRQCLEHAGVDGAVLSTFRRQDSDTAGPLAALGALSLLGREPLWDRLTSERSRIVSLPAYPWQREKYPLPRTTSRTPALAGAADVGLLGARLETAIDTFESRFSGEEQIWFQDHVIHGAPTLPASGFAVLASQAAAAVFGPGTHTVEDLVVGEPLRVGADVTHRFQIACVRETSDVAAFRAFGREAERGTPWIQHAAARLLRSSAAPSAAPCEALPSREIVGSAHYDGLASRGAFFGPGYRTVERIRLDGGVAVGDVVAPSGLGNIEKAPALIDGAIQVASALLHADSADGALFVPFGLARIRLEPSLPDRLRVHARRDPGAGETVDISAFDESSREIVTLTGVRFRRSQPTTTKALPLYAVSWLGQEKMPTRGATTGVVVVDRDSPLPVPGVECVVYLARGAESGTGGGSELPEVNRDAQGLLTLVQALVAQPSPPRLAVVTRGARAVTPGDVPDLSSAPLLGIAQVIGIEHPELRVVSIDLDPRSTEDAPLAVEWADDSGEEAVAMRGGRRFVARLRSEPPTAPLRHPRRLVKGDAAVIDSMAFVDLERRPPGPGQVEIEVLAAGINFRDVLNVLGMYPGDPVPLGNECAGVVTTAGPGVVVPRVGDTVLGVAIGSLGSHVIVDARLVVPKPPTLSLVDAAATPIAFLTAAYALDHLAGMKAGDRVLVHAAAGGVGLAAVELARAAGATVFATAGTEEKRAFLRERGVEHVFDSRSVDFAEGVRHATRGAGVDIVLNSLSGEFIARSFDVLANGGRFLEIGKRGIWSEEQAHGARADVAYHVIYLGGICEESPALIHEHLQTIVADLSSGRLRKLPARAWDADDAHDAFRFMAQAKHIGKLVLLFGGASVARSIRPDATYVVTGGMGGVGREIAESLVARGARHLALLGRRAPGAEAAASIERMERQGAKVRCVFVDVSDAAALDAALAEIENESPAIAGIVHAAGVLDDGPIATQQWGRFASVFAPKVMGAWNLHRWSMGRRLDFFSLFSSAASLLGWAGQSSYAAANAFLDSLAHYRQAHGLPGQSLNWGAWKNAGMAASLGAADRERMRRLGMIAFDACTGVDAFAEATSRPQPQLAPLSMDFAAFASVGGATRKRPFLFEVLEEAPHATPSHAVSIADRSLQQALAEAPKAKRRALILSRVKAQVIRTLGLAPSFALDPRRGLRDIGLDSLMAVELRNALQQLAGLTLPATLLFDYPTVDALTEHLGSLLIRKDEPVRAPVVATTASDAAAPASDDDIEAALRAELLALRREGRP